MTESAESELPWDEAVDVLCVGDGPGSLAYAIHCAASDLDVLIIESPELDPQTAQWVGAMTEDLGDGLADPHLPLIRAEAVAAARVTDRTTLEPFVGGELRQWSAGCLSSPFGVMFTEVPDLSPMRTAEGRTITAGIAGPYRFTDGPHGAALVRWLRERADGLFAPVDDRLEGLIAAEGRVAGVLLATVDGPRRVGVAGGVAIALGAGPDDWPPQPELDGLTADVAVIGRPAGRFARVGLLRR